jgi:hypothetical protein
LGAAQSITGTATLNARFPGQWFQVRAPIVASDLGRDVNRQR